MSKRGFYKVNEVKLSLNELGILTGIDARNLKKKLSGMTPENGPNNSTLYPLKEAVHAIYVNVDDSLPALKLQREKAEARLAEAKAIKVELENAVSEKQLVPMAEAEKMYCDLVSCFRTRMLAIPNKAAFIVANMRNPGQIEAHLKELICEALDALSTSNPVEDPSADQNTASTDD